MLTVLAVIALCCVAWALVAGLRAVAYCQRHGVSINVAFLGVEMLGCLGRYRKLTRVESGSTGPLFYHYQIAINAALAVALILLFTHIV